MKHHLFISYRHPDEEIAAAIEAGLTAKGFKCWRDPRIPWGADFPRVIEKAIDNTQAVLVLLSDESGYSEWIGKEIRMAQNRGCPVLPVMLNESQLPHQLKSRLNRVHHMQVDAATLPDDIDELEGELRKLGVGSLEDDIDTDLVPRYLEEAFPSLNSFDHERLETIASWTNQRFLGMPGNGFWTTHGLRHSNGIIRHLRDLADDRIRHNNEFAFCLAAAACLHDAGLVRRDVTTENGDRPVAREVVDFPRRREHHRRSDTLVRSLAGELLLTGREARMVADLCRYHNSRTNAQELSQNPDVAELVSIFRIANACDLGPVRAPAFFWTWKRKDIWPEEDDTPNRGRKRTLPQHEKDAALTFWLRNLTVNEVHVDGDDREITLCCHAPTSDLFFIPGQVHSYLQRTVEQLAPFIGVWTVDFQAVEVDEDSSVLSMEDMVELGARMYSDPEAVLRSSSDIGEYLVRSVIALTDDDHIRKSRKRAQDTPAENPRGDIAQKKDETGVTPNPDKQIVATLEKLFTDLPRKRPELHYLQWLSSKFREVTADRDDPSYGQQITQLRGEFVRIDEQRHLYPLFDPAIEERECPFEAISRHAYKRLTSMSPSKDEYTVFAFGRSGPVCAFIRYCASAGKKMRVRTPVMRPAAEGSTLKVVESLEGQHGIEVEVIPDAAIPHILNGDPENDSVGPCDVTLMGCEAILNTSESFVASSLGALAVAQMVDHAPCELWVLSEASKEHSEEGISCWLAESETCPGMLPASFFMHEAAASRVAADSNISYPRSEIVPGKLVDLLITEEGANPLTQPLQSTREHE